MSDIVLCRHLNFLIYFPSFRIITKKEACKRRKMSRMTDFFFLTDRVSRPFHGGRTKRRADGAPLFYMILLTVRGKSTTSRMFSMPVTYMTKRSKPSPNPPCGAVPNFLRSRYCS